MPIKFIFKEHNALLISYYYLNESQPLTNCVWDLSCQSLPWGKRLDKMIGTVRGIERPPWKVVSFILLSELFEIQGALRCPLT